MKATLRIITRFLILLILVAAVAGGMWYYRNQAAAAQTTSDTDSYTQIIPAQRGSLSSALTVVGELAAVQQSDLVFEHVSTTTALKTLNVKAGNTVKAGDVLAAVDAASYQQTVDQAKSDLAAAEETLAELQTPATELEIAQADQAVAAAEQDLAEAQQALVDLQNPATSDLADLKNVVSDAEESLELAKLQRTVTEYASTAKNQRNYEYLVSWHERKIRELEAIVATGEANLEQTELLASEKEDLVEARAAMVNAQTQRQLALDTADATIKAAEAALADAKEALADAQNGGEALEVAEAQLTIKQAVVALAVAKDDRAQLDAGAEAVDLATAQADVDAKKLALADAEKALAGSSLAAPFDGTILAVNVDQGGLVSSSTAILTIANLDQLEVLASVDETTVRSVMAGQTALVTFDAVPGQTINGVVGDIPLQGELQGDVMVYEVPVTLQGIEELPLLVGMTANVSIATGQVTDALLVPTMALTKSNGMYQVLIADPANPEAEPQAVPVEVGLSDGTYTQITGGLNDGDQVVVELAGSTTSTNMMPGGGMMMLVAGGGPPPGAGAPPSSGQGRP